MRTRTDLYNRVPRHLPRRHRLLSPPATATRHGRRLLCGGAGAGVLGRGQLEGGDLRPITRGITRGIMRVITRVVTRMVIRLITRAIMRAACKIMGGPRGVAKEGVERG
jgi:hypothetical protein